MSAGVKALLN